MRWLRLITAATVVNYIALVGLGAWKVMPKTGGLTPFDLRMFGYSFDDAMAYLDAVNFETAALMLGPMHWLDTSFPALLTITLIGWGWVLAAGALRVAVVALPLIYLALDYTENFLVMQMIAGQLPTPDRVALASTVTMAKFVFVAASFVVVFALAWKNSKRDT